MNSSTNEVLFSLRSPLGPLSDDLRRSEFAVVEATRRIARTEAVVKVSVDRTDLDALAREQFRATGRVKVAEAKLGSAGPQIDSYEQLTKKVGGAPVVASLIAGQVFSEVDRLGDRLGGLADKLATTQMSGRETAGEIARAIPIIGDGARAFDKLGTALDDMVRASIGLKTSGQQIAEWNDKVKATEERREAVYALTGRIRELATAAEQGPAEKLDEKTAAYRKVIDELEEIQRRAVELGKPFNQSEREQLDRIKSAAENRYTQSAMNEATYARDAEKQARAEEDRRTADAVGQVRSSADATEAAARRARRRGRAGVAPTGTLAHRRRRPCRRVARESLQS